MRISVVIPCWGDRGAVEARVAELAGAPFCHEIVVADATPSGARGGARWCPPGARVVRCLEPGRGLQMNAGAAECSGDVLLFNHADTRLTARHLEEVAVTLVPGLVGGAFYKDLAHHHPKLAWAEPWVRWYSERHGVIYGDQSVFVWRQVFDAMDGFAPVRLMEDVDFSDRLRRAGSTVLLDPPLRTSMRRFRSRGYLRNRLGNLVAVWLWRAGLVGEDRLYRWYYGEGDAR